MRNGDLFEWENTKKPHLRNGPCFCQPIQDLKDPIMRLVKSIKGEKCRITLACPDISEQDLHDFAVCLIWYFRKSVVDSIIQWAYQLSTSQRIRSTHEDVRISGSLQSMLAQSCQAVSVGSLNITSDYDVTMYGTCASTVIPNFHNIFWSFFSAPSSQVFDTNVYGSSFIDTLSMAEASKSYSRVFYGTQECSSIEFVSEMYHYVLSPEEFAKKIQGDTPSESMKALPANDVNQLLEDTKVATIQQHLWALLKLYKSTQTYMENAQDASDQDVDNFKIISSYDKSSSIIDDKVATYIAFMHNTIVDSLPTVRSFHDVVNNLVVSQRTEKDDSRTKYNVNHKSISQNASNVAQMLRNSSATGNGSFSKNSAGIIRSPTSHMLRSPTSGYTGFASTDFYNKEIDELLVWDDIPMMDISYIELPFELVKRVDSYSLLLNTISFFNYLGSETYYTRGAFMHVVFALQTCKGQFERKLTQSALMDSFVENLADCISHDFKRKYLVRMADAVSKLPNIGKAQSANYQKWASRQYLNEQEKVAVLEDAFFSIIANMIMTCQRQDLKAYTYEIVNTAKYIRSLI